MIDYNKLTQVCKYIFNNYNFTEHKDYIDSRINQDMQNKFEFGYFPYGDNIFILTQLFDKNNLIDEKLIFEKKVLNKKIYFSYFENHNLVMPYKDVYGNYIGLVGRNITDEKGVIKYKNTSFYKSQHLFGLFEAKESILKNDSCFIVEGQMDVISSHQNNLQNIAALGSGSMSFYQFGLILRYTKNINLLLDNDEAGQKGRNRIMQQFGKYANIKNYYLPKDVKDIDEYFKKYSLNDFYQNVLID